MVAHTVLFEVLQAAWLIVLYLVSYVIFSIVFHIFSCMVRDTISIRSYLVLSGFHSISHRVPYWIFYIIFHMPIYIYIYIPSFFYNFYIIFYMVLYNLLHSLLCCFPMTLLTVLYIIFSTVFSMAPPPMIFHIVYHLLCSLYIVFF